MQTYARISAKHHVFCYIVYIKFFMYFLFKSRTICRAFTAKQGVVFLKQISIDLLQQLLLSTLKYFTKFIGICISLFHCTFILKLIFAITIRCRTSTFFSSRCRRSLLDMHTTPKHSKLLKQRATHFQPRDQDGKSKVCIRGKKGIN